MIKKSKMLILTITLMILATIVTGCKSSKTDSAKENSTTPTVAPTNKPTATPKPIDYENATIKDVYKDDFSCGVILNGWTVNDEKWQNIVKENFNSVTCENEMKPDSLLDRQTSISDPKYDEAPAVKFWNADPILQFAKDNGIKVRAHTLVWHAQTPRWFFSEGYSDAPDAKLVTKEKMLKRMENYIKAVMEHANTTYPGVIYAWDVVNEAVNPGDGEVNGLRKKDSLWYQVVGPEFIEKAFEYARKYAAKDQKLFYNDYSTDEPGKVVYISELLSKIYKQGNIDGIGLQTHVGMTSPSLSQIDSSVRDYAKIGLEIQVTELDVLTHENTKEEMEKQAVRYKRLFLYFKNWKKQGINISNVTFWGLADGQSWLTGLTGEESFPLLFDDEYKKKPAFYGVLQDPKIPLY